MNVQIALKYAADRFAAVVLLLLLLPIFALVSVAILIDDGRPVFFRQERLGAAGKPFKLWKFRTMMVDSEAYLDSQGNPTANRVTRIGRLLRSSSIDELPNMFSIVSGHMSFIGPRPTMPDHYRLYTPRQRDRFLMRPGITGLAQVNGRNLIPWSKRLAYDAHYVDNYSLLLDVQIIVRTFLVVILRQGISLDRNREQAFDLEATPPEEPA